MKNLLLKLGNNFFIIPIFFLLIVKIPHLYLPYFWDEAWSYFPAVYKMYETGPGMLPGSLPLWDAKGHPLFFFFISSLWMRLFGNEVFTVHLLPLLISVAVLVSTYFMVKRHSNKWAANAAVLLFSVQSLFLAQATMLLPEMLITLFLILTIDSYLSKRYVLFALLASLMVLTKETSVVFVCAFFLFHTLVHLRQGKESRKYIIESLLIITPFFVYAGFLILHKKEFGTYLFQDHVGYIQFDMATIVRKLKIATAIIFTGYGRNVILAALIYALGWILIKRKKIEFVKLLSLILLLMLLFLAFSVLNFYTQRYMLSLLALYVIIVSVLLSQVKLKKQYVTFFILAIITVVPLYYSFTKKTSSDSDLGYVEVVKTYQQMVKFCEEENWQDKPIAASFNMIFCLRNPHLGYVSAKKGFSNVMNMGKFRSAEVFINESTFYDYRQELDSIKNEKVLVKTFKQKHAWGEIYTNKDIE
ncbi:MAG: glycosyltransferase family 39 protein [Chlorobi bacterium]|nr:glycosyltransferase family 39 protein [Chlorobiota bacterium]